MDYYQRYIETSLECDRLRARIAELEGAGYTGHFGDLIDIKDKRIAELEPIVVEARLHVMDHENCGCGLCVALAQLDRTFIKSR